MADVAEAFVWACSLDVAARKPGNVSLASAGHRMQAQQFIASARAAAPAIAAAGQPVGARIELAMRATLAAVGCNTNLGIVLLCAPLAVAAESAVPPGAKGLRRALQQVLDTLDLADAQAAFRAIALTQPAGLGQVAQQDVHAPPSVTLRAAMALAAGRDSVARQYDEGYADLFDRALGWFGGVVGPPEQALQRVFLEALVRWPDSHIVRKHGEAAAHTVMQEALPWCDRARAGLSMDADPTWAAWDESLKARGLNPGTSADLCVATAFLHGLLHMHMCR
ncbi:Triphosphoribosyl-dephospho-CoA synthetase [Burkholderiales bacterium JOSHI_001]|nr:Triphosphoribosyl-dephospho-CoA synthetase [Burkholderiales bacterium JOSHI_001]